jgi:hypothetical protein
VEDAVVNIVGTFGRALRNRIESSQNCKVIVTSVGKGDFQVRNNVGRKVVSSHPIKFGQQFALWMA